jgi:hypothetical protein
MSTEVPGISKQGRWKLTIDEWAVGWALLATLLVRLGVFKHIAW